jgi:DegV family protein with EDD domain
MSKIAIVTDSTCDLPMELIRPLPVEVVPIRVIYKDREYRDRIEITPEEVYNRLEQEVPTTSLPSPEDIFQTFQKLKNEGFTHVLVITISSGLSNTFGTFKLIAEEFPELNIKLIDSKGVSWILGFLVLEAAKLAIEQVDFQAIVQKVEACKEKIKAYFMLDTLKYLEAGGRIGKVASTMGSLLNLKPIISLDQDGQLYPFAIARGKKQSMKKLVDPIMEKLASVKAQIAILHSKAEEEALQLVEKFRKIENVAELYMETISPALVVHAGPGLLGIVMKEEE